MANQQCKCGRGYVSHWDGKCGQCRTARETRIHHLALSNVLVEASDRAIEVDVYRKVRKEIEARQ